MTADHIIFLLTAALTLGSAIAVVTVRNLVKAHGENGAPQAGFTECLNAMQQGNVAMWYDATSAAGSLEATDSPVKGKVGYVAAPVNKTAASGWLYTWAWSIQKASKKQENAYSHRPSTRST